MSAKCTLPAVAVVDVGQRRRDAAFRHHRVRLAEQRLADQADLTRRRRRFDRRPQPGAAGADDEHVVLVGLVCRSEDPPVGEMPIEQRRT